MDDQTGVHPLGAVVLAEKAELPRQQLLGKGHRLPPPIV